MLFVKHITSLHSHYIILYLNLQLFIKENAMDSDKTFSTAFDLLFHYIIVKFSI